MCKYGTYKLLKVNYRNLERCIDACIANEIKELNENGIITLGCCCGHGEHAPVVLVNEKSIKSMLTLGYDYDMLIEYSNVDISGVHQFKLNTGCKTSDEINKWSIEQIEGDLFSGFS